MFASGQTMPGLAVLPLDCSNKSLGGGYVGHRDHFHRSALNVCIQRLHFYEKKGHQRKPTPLEKHLTLGASRSGWFVCFELSSFFLLAAEDCKATEARQNQ